MVEHMILLLYLLPISSQFGPPLVLERRKFLFLKPSKSHLRIFGQLLEHFFVLSLDKSDLFTLAKTRTVQQQQCMKVLQEPVEVASSFSEDCRTESAQSNHFSENKLVGQVVITSCWVRTGSWQ